MAAGTVASLAVFGLAPPASAATGVTVYAAPSPVGTGDCSSSASACSLQAAVAQANNETGDTVVLADGSYAGVALRLTASMSLTAAPGAHPVLTGDGTSADDVILVDAGTVSVSGLTVTGGNIGIETLDAAGPLTVTGSTFTANLVGIEAGTATTVTGSTLSANGSCGLQVFSTAGASVTNSTSTGNGNCGIALENGSSLTAIGDTISDNGTGISSHLSSGSGSVVIVGSSVIAGNGRGCAVVPAVPFTDARYNVESDNSCGLGPASKTATGDAAIGLSPLAGNGSAGPQTQAIAPGSAAYQVVPAGSVPCPPADQRGVPRPGSGTTACDAGAYEYHQPVTLAQAAPASGTVTAGTAFTDQLAVTGALGPVSYTTTSPAGPVTVSPAGTITAPATTPAGVYQLAGTITDPFGDSGTWVYTLTVASPGPARADLSVSLGAPTAVNASAPVQVAVTVTNTGPSTATTVGTALLIPRGWTVTDPGTGTMLGPLLTFTAAALAAKATLSYTVTLAAPPAKGRALIAAYTASAAGDPNYGNNFTAALIQVR
jgi:hypothetical protein